MIAASVLAVTLAACGSSSGTTSVVESPGNAGSTGSSSAATGASGAGASTPAQPAVATPGCRQVPAPASRAGEQASKPTTQLDSARSYTVRLATNCGPIAVALAVKEAPKTTSSFAHLVLTGYYDGLTFHRIVPGFVIQGGDPNGNGSGGPSWGVVEPPPANLHYTKGVVAMAKGPTAPSGASGSQFFIVTGSAVNLPPQYALVGHVVAGERAVEAIARVPTEAGAKPLVPVVIEKATLSVR